MLLFSKYFVSNSNIHVFKDDTSIVAQENDWGSNSSKMVSQIDMECRRMRKVDNEIAAPFEGNVII